MPRIPIEFGGLYNSQHESKVPQGRAWACQNATTRKKIIGGSQRYSLFWDRTSYNSGDVGYGATYCKHSNNEIQKLPISAGVPTSGTVRLTWSGQQTAVIAYNATAATVQNAFELLSNINTGDVKCTGGPWPGQPIYVEFRGQYAGADQSIITLTANTMNNSATIVPAEFIKGGVIEKYLAVIKKNGNSTCSLYGIDIDGTETELATGLTASDWFFEQFGNQVWAVNATDGFHYYRIGGSWDDTGGTARPSRPGTPPGSFAYTTAPELIIFVAGDTVTVSNLTETTTKVATGGLTIRNTGAAITDTPTEIVIQVDLATLRDYQFNDKHRVRIVPSTSSIHLVPDSAQYTMVNAAATVLTPTSQVVGPVGLIGQFALDAHFGDVDRTTRDDIDLLKLAITVTDWPANASLSVGFEKGFVSMANYSPVSAESTWSKKSKIEYAYTSYNATTDVESLLSDAGLTTAEVPPAAGGSADYGAWVQLSMVGNPSLTTSDRLYVYRREKNTRQWRRLPVDSNNLTTFGSANVTSGSTTFIDKWMESEIANFPVPTIPDFPGNSDIIAGFVIGSWKRSLQLGAGKKNWASFVRKPELYAPDPEDEAASRLYNQTNADNPDAGRTQFVSDNKSEEINNILGQDSLYAVTTLSTCASVGDTPISASPFRRMPGSRGSVGKKAACRFGGGIEVGSEDGIWYQSVGRVFQGEDDGSLKYREETMDVRNSYDTLLGSSFTGLIICEHLDELWAFNETRYIVRDREGSWHEGTFADSVKYAVPQRARGLRFMDSTGRIHTLSDDYATDNGTTALWAWETGVLDGPPSRVTDIELLVKGSPRCKLWVFASDGDKTHPGFGKYFEYIFDTDESQEAYRRPLKILPGMRYKIFFSGTCGTDEVHAAALHIEGAGKDYNQ